MKCIQNFVWLWLIQHIVVSLWWEVSTILCLTLIKISNLCPNSDDKLLPARAGGWDWQWRWEEWEKQDEQGTAHEPNTSCLRKSKKIVLFLFSSSSVHNCRRAQNITFGNSKKNSDCDRSILRWCVTLEWHICHWNIFFGHHIFVDKFCLAICLVNVNR